MDLRFLPVLSKTGSVWKGERVSAGTLAPCSARRPLLAFAGAWMRITSAPKSPNCIQQKAVGKKSPISRTLTPSSGRDMERPRLLD